jgi:hypothetical protein
LTVGRPPRGLGGAGRRQHRVHGRRGGGVGPRRVVGRRRGRRARERELEERGEAEHVAAHVGVGARQLLGADVHAVVVGTGSPDSTAAVPSPVSVTAGAPVASPASASDGTTAAAGVRRPCASPTA